MRLSGWGRYPVLETRVIAPRSVESLRSVVREGPDVIARGNGRAYGDSAIGLTTTVHTRHLNRMVSFDNQTGVLVAEAGVLLGDVIAAFLPRGWFPIVTPGTKFVTIGGAIAADVHGKNHHRVGSFRHCVEWVEVMGDDGEITRCSRASNSALFDHTLGGMGLTGIIVRAAVRLQPVESGWIKQKTIAAPSLQDAMNAFEAAQDATYSVAWIDCLSTGRNLGRSLVMLGEHAAVSDLPGRYARQPLICPTKRKKSVPMDLPSFALNRHTVRAFNAGYYWMGVRNGDTKLVNWDTFFYPLDAILGWNRIYGRSGFAQFQCALPIHRSRAGLTELLQAIAGKGMGSFLSVLKRFGPQDSPFSFPMEGYTLALDFPISDKTLILMDKLDRITLEHGGRFYLAKDSRMSANTLNRSDDRVTRFREARNVNGWRDRFRSAQSERLEI
ncbi:FAD-binding oxidoreductase [Ruegeria arenilitoris]|uniref:FAD-binding oxidoreductase n=1 Tax=Ruegeria arenilitoris TaxID=1173585 RepID=UPI001480CA16|nr:FAD-binding oxidoreductase [Ruegeria arenilitoris]